MAKSKFFNIKKVESASMRAPITEIEMVVKEINSFGTC